MEGELVTAGIKLASKSSSIDYRNPIISIDMGTTLAGQIIDDSKPYANLLCNYVGLAGGISDILLRGCGIIDENYSTIDLENTIKSPLLNEQKLHEITEKLHKYVDIMEVPSDVQNFGLVNVYSRNKKEDDVKIIGSRINDEEKLVNTFNKYVDVNNLAEVMLQIDDFYAYYIKG
jgi:hypothetical protein